MLNAYTARNMRQLPADVGHMAAVIYRLVQLAAYFADTGQRKDGQQPNGQTSTAGMPTVDPSWDVPDTPDADTWFRELHPRLYAYVRYRVADIAQAEDLTSDIVERALTHLDSYDARKGAFSTWLFRIAHNTLANHFKQQQRRSQRQIDLGERLEDLASNEPSPEQSIVRQEEIARLLSCVRTLSAHQQDILSLRFAGQLTNREIASILRMNERTVSVTLLRALRALRAKLPVQPDSAQHTQAQGADSRSPAARAAGGNHVS